MTAHKHGGWRKLQAAQRATMGFAADTIGIPPKPPAPRDSWWTRPVRSREEFDRLAHDRSRAAGWVGLSS